MGVDICYFVDHDLPMNSADAFIKEFSKRANGNFEVCDRNNDCDNSDETISQNAEKKVKWCVSYDSKYGEYDSFEKYFPNPKGSIAIFFSDENFNVELDLAKNTLEIWSLKNNWRSEIDFCRWHTMDNFFAEEIDFAKNWTQKLFSQIKEVIVPIFHSKQVLLTKDSSSLEHETLYGNYLMENGETIEAALLKNSEFENPCPILRNDEAFGHSEDLEQPFYVFDL